MEALLSRTRPALATGSEDSDYTDSLFSILVGIDIYRELGGLPMNWNIYLDSRKATSNRLLSP
jgi:hypothetical protein